MSISYGKTSYSLIKITTQIETSEVKLLADVSIPAPPRGIMIIALNSHKENKNTLLINELVKHQYGVVVINLLTDYENQLGIYNDNLNLISERLVTVTKWVKRVFGEGEISICIWSFGKVSAATFRASIQLQNIAKAMICREARADLALDILDKVSIPTLLLINELNKELIKHNKYASEHLNQDAKLVIVKASSSPTKHDEYSIDILESIRWLEKYLTKEVCPDNLILR